MKRNSNLVIVVPVGAPFEKLEKPRQNETELLAKVDIEPGVQEWIVDGRGHGDDVSDEKHGGEVVLLGKVRIELHD